MTDRRADDLATQLLAHPTATEARAWLMRADGVVRTLGETDSPTDCLAFVDEWYDAGAVAVIATEIVAHELEDLEGTRHFENTGHLLVQLPKDPLRRKGVFQLHARVVARLGFDPTPDVGQEYLYCPLD